MTDEGFSREVKAVLGLVVGDEATDLYILEVLTHAGLSFRLLAPKRLNPDKAPICLLAGRKSLGFEERKLFNGPSSEEGL